MLLFGCGKGKQKALPGGWRKEVGPRDGEPGEVSPLHRGSFEMERPEKRRRWQSNPLGMVLQTTASPSGSGVDASRRAGSVLARNRTWSATFAKSRASITPRG